MLEGEDYEKKIFKSRYLAIILFVSIYHRYLSNYGIFFFLYRKKKPDCHSFSFKYYHDFIVYPPRKILVLFSVPLLLSISPLLIALWTSETVTQPSILHMIGYMVGIYCPLLLLGMLISTSAKKRLYYLFYMTVFSLPAIIFWFYYAMTGSLVHPDTLMAIFQTNQSEAISYLKDTLSISSILVFIAFMLLITILYKAISQLPTYSLLSSKKKSAIGIFVVVILTSFYLIRHNKDNMYHILYKGTRDYVASYTAFAEKQKERKLHAADLSIIGDSKKGVYFLVIGESQNRMHMSAYGYARNTTPWLMEQRNNDSFIFYENTYSCHTHTVPVLTYALTAKNQYNTIKIENAVSLVEAAKAAGFHTVWLSNQVQYGAWDTPISVIAAEADEQYWLNKNIGETTKTNYYDEKLTDSLQQIVPQDKMLIIIHLMGNHGSYEDRYPNTYNIYHGSDNRIDNYDNSIRYNDTVMQELYEKAKAFPNFQSLVYFSDHADAVDQNLAHDASHFVFPMAYIPFYMAFSQSYQQENPVIIENLQAHRADYFTNDLIFNAMLSIMGISLDSMYEPYNDISSPSYDANVNRFTTLYGKVRLKDKEQA